LALKFHAFFSTCRAALFDATRPFQCANGLVSVLAERELDGFAVVALRRKSEVEKNAGSANSLEQCRKLSGFLPWRYCEQGKKVFC
jgi:hypothetical protein